MGPDVGAARHGRFVRRSRTYYRRRCLSYRLATRSASRLSRRSHARCVAEPGIVVRLADRRAAIRRASAAMVAVYCCPSRRTSSAMSNRQRKRRYVRRRLHATSRVAVTGLCVLSLSPHATKLFVPLDRPPSAPGALNPLGFAGTASVAHIWTAEGLPSIPRPSVSDPPVVVIRPRATGGAAIA
jgi:hypothetical protein